ncbi:MAG: hypothetical protein RLZZ546_188 [Bacteroidota bacterium]
MKHLFSTALFILLGLSICGQSIDTIYRVEDMKKSVSFAMLTLGGDVLTLPGGKMSINNENVNLPSSLVPRFTIGGTHFWGHADFYVHFPLGISFNKTPSFASSYNLFEEVETGAKFYPWAMKPKRLVPFVGISFQPFIFRTELKDKEYKYGGATHEKFTTPIHAGLTYMTNKLIFNLGVRYDGDRNFNYYTSPIKTSLTSIQPFSINFGIVRYMDTDRGLGTVNATDQLNKKHHILKKHNKLNAWYWGIGPSAALQLSKSPFLKSKHPYLYDDMLNSFLIPELTVGRYFHKADMNLSTSFRYMAWSSKAFDTKLKMNRISLAIEPYKFLFDYHGFVPFVGPSLNIDKLSVNINDKVTSANKTSLGIVFGWDIRVTQTGTSLLRTNLRYVPNLHLKVDNEKLMFDHLEFNFIQYVHFFGRSKAYDKYRK